MPQTKNKQILTYLLTPWSRVLLEKLTGFAANQEIPRILWNPKKNKQIEYIIGSKFISTLTQGLLYFLIHAHFEGAVICLAATAGSFMGK